MAAAGLFVFSGGIVTLETRLLIWWGGTTPSCSFNRRVFHVALGPLLNSNGTNLGHFVAVRCLIYPAACDPSGSWQLQGFLSFSGGVVALETRLLIWWGGTTPSYSFNRRVVVEWWGSPVTSYSPNRRAAVECEKNKISLVWFLLSWSFSCSAVSLKARLLI